jgi:hypothetical protein
MKLGNRMPVDLGVVLVAGLTMALAGCTPGAMTLAGLSTPAAALSAPRPISAHSAPSVEVVVGERSAPVSAHSAPAYCLDVTTPNARMTVGEVSAPRCTVINNGRAPVADASAPVADASAPQCVDITTPNASLRRC